MAHLLEPGVREDLPRQACQSLYLQVTRDAGAALGLYRRAGFEEACTSQHRTAHYGAGG